MVADFLFEKDALFARINLDDQELDLYTRLADKMKQEHPTPRLVIYLQASPETLQSRIAARNAELERNFPEGYIKRVHSAYSEFFHQYDDAPLLIVIRII